MKLHRNKKSTLCQCLSLRDIESDKNILLFGTIYGADNWINDQILQRTNG